MITSFLSYLGQPHILLLGIVVAGGMLSKYVFILYLLALLGASALDRELRKKLFCPALILSFAIALLISAPHFLWLFENLPPATDVAAPALNVSGLLKLVTAILGFLSPLLIILLFLFPTAIMVNPSIGTHENRWASLLERYFLILLTLSAFALLALDMDRLRTHYMFVLVPMIIYFFVRIKWLVAPLSRLRLYGCVLALFAMTSILGLVIKFVGEPLKCDRCQHHIPYAELAGTLRGAGFKGGTIFAYWHPDPIAGNLREQFPTSRVISAKHINVQPRQRKVPGQCLLIWPSTDNNVGRLSTITMANRQLGTMIDENTPPVLITLPLNMGWGKKISFGYILLDPGEGSCR